MPTKSEILQASCLTGTEIGLIPEDWEIKKGEEVRFLMVDIAEFKWYFKINFYLLNFLS
jgi:hypothetical protein